MEDLSVAGLVLLLVVVPACSSDIHRGPAGSADVADVGVTDGTADPSFDTRTADSGPSGRADGDAGDVESDIGDADAGPLRGPPYPIVLAHGFGGFEHLADVEQLPYFYGVAEELRSEKEVVLVTEVDPFADSYTRGEQLRQQIETFATEKRWKNVHIVGHSQGGLDARYVAHHRRDLVASVTTISSPHGGTRVADIALRLADSERTREVIDAVSELLGRELYDEFGNETGAVDSLEQFSEPGIAEFNRRVTDREEVYYASFAGRTDRPLDRSECAVELAPEFVEVWKRTGDSVDPNLSVTESILDGPIGIRPNDGMVSVENAKWGDFLGCIPADHLDEVGQLVGDDPGVFNGWDHLEFYKRLVAFLHERESNL
jgi:triacylglycerol lipase